jgi:hypothetical protein
MYYSLIHYTHYSMNPGFLNFLGFMLTESIKYTRLRSTKTDSLMRLLTSHACQATAQNSLRIFFQWFPCPLLYHRICMFIIPAIGNCLSLAFMLIIQVIFSHLHTCSTNPISVSFDSWIWNTSKSNNTRTHLQGHKTYAYKDMIQGK